MPHINIDLVETRRKKLKLKQYQLANILGITKGHYCLIRQEKRNFTLRHIEILWRELNIPLQKLIIKEHS